jgi:hypothetical protein
MKSRTHGIDWPRLVSCEAHGEVCLHTASALENAIKESAAYLLLGPSRLYRPHFGTPRCVLGMLSSLEVKVLRPT